MYLFDRTHDTAEKTKRIIEEAGGKAEVIDCDIARPEMIEQGFKQVADQSGKLDIVFANAGINGSMAPIETMKIEDWDETMDINLRGTFATVKYAVPYLKDQGGSVIITSSINGNRVFSGVGFSAYASTKAAQVAFMKMAALELAQYKIRVNAICPGAIETNINENTYPSDDLKEVQIPVEFPEGSHPLEDEPGSPEQVSNLVLFLASSESSHVTGTEIYVDGAESLLRG
ncbi:putative short-chain type dehydrogenase/reductase [compost metagenome]